MIDRLCGPFKDGITRVFLKGNHEDRMIDFLDKPVKHGQSWMKFGGREALHSYGVDLPEPLENIDWLHLRDALWAALPVEHHRFLGELPLA